MPLRLSESAASRAEDVKAALRMALKSDSLAKLEEDWIAVPPGQVISMRASAPSATLASSATAVRRAASPPCPSPEPASALADHPGQH